MISIINKYIGLIGFLVALPMICIAAYYKYYCNNEFEILGSLAIVLWITTMTLQYELNKEKPKNWFIILVTGVFFVAIFLIIFN